MHVLEILDYCTIIVGLMEYLIECDSEWLDVTSI